MAKQTAAGGFLIQRNARFTDPPLHHRQHGGKAGGLQATVALIDDAEATLKYFRREGAMIRLDPANRSYDPQRYAPAQVRVQGKLSGLLRRYD